METKPSNEARPNNRHEIHVLAAIKHPEDFAVYLLQRSAKMIALKTYAEKSGNLESFNEDIAKRQEDIKNRIAALAEVEGSTSLILDQAYAFSVNILEIQSAPEEAINMYSEGVEYIKNLIAHKETDSATEKTMTQVNQEQSAARLGELALKS